MQKSKGNVAPHGEVRLRKTLRLGLATLVASFLFLPPVFAACQAPAPDKQTPPAQEAQTKQSGTSHGPASPADTSKPSNPAPKPAASADQQPIGAEAKQSTRMFWIVPNFAAVNSDTVLPPLSARDKYKLATEDSVDYSSFVWAGLIAAQSMALKADPELHQGLKGYGRYYWRAFADQASGAFFTEAVVPALMHEDPRYYTMGHGGFFRRTAYGLSRVVVIKTDSGGRHFNTSELGGNALEAGLANLYYPPQERGIGNTALNWATQMESACLNNVIKEFWPDICRKVFRQK